MNECRNIKGMKIRTEVARTVSMITRSKEVHLFKWTVSRKCYGSILIVLPRQSAADLLHAQTVTTEYSDVREVYKAASFNGEFYYNVERGYFRTDRNHN
jgi:hypothetical protein